MKHLATALSVIAAFCAVMCPTAATGTEPMRHAAIDGVRVRVPASVVEGERFKVVVRVGRPAAAQRVILERQNTNILDEDEWIKVKSVLAKGIAKHVFKVFAEETSTGRFRARVTFRDAKPVTSKPARTTVWRWTYLYAFASYYKTTGVWGEYLDSFAMNGTQYNGWHTYGNPPSWEERFTLGRHCKAMRGDFGVTDDSSDGTSALIALTADDERVFTSGALTPGMVQRATVSIDKPYRLSITALNTSSTAGLRVEPAIGMPEVLCTGL